MVNNMNEEKLMRKGKIVYIPPEKCYTNVKIEETPHGYRLYRDGESRHFAIVPKSKMVVVEYRGE
tara:strand:- start:1295 stop:1489 length:195 start_codon:yes stop_codon:yes gene_type:complete